MTEDLDLFAWRGRGAAPVVTDPELQILIGALDRRRWQTAAQLRERTAFDDRKVRALASDSAGRIISGQRGYCLITEATTAEIDHAADWLISQGKAMIKRGIAIRTQAHQLIA